MHVPSKSDSINRTSGDDTMKSHYAYAVYMPTVGLLTKTVADTEEESIQRFAEFEPRITWLEALKGGYKMKKLVIVELK